MSISWRVEGALPLAQRWTVRRETLNRSLNGSHVRPERRLISSTASAVDCLAGAQVSFADPPKHSVASLSIESSDRTAATIPIALA